MFSGGAGSWAAAKRVRELHPDEPVVLLFSDVGPSDRSEHQGEDGDTYRFIEQAATNVGAELVVLRDGRDIWQVFKDDRFLGNARLANCSKFLKQRPAMGWLEANAASAETTVYVGIDWTESHRLPAIEAAYLPYVAKAPLCDAPYLDKGQVMAWMRSEGLEPPRLYADGFPHNNCGGFCVRAGQSQFRLLLQKMPERYAYHEAKEEELREYLGKNVAVMNDRRGGGPRRAMTMREWRERIEAEEAPPEDDDGWGGCGCFTQAELPL
jgi:hypothetical protein